MAIPPNIDMPAQSHAHRAGIALIIGQINRVVCRGRSAAVDWNPSGIERDGRGLGRGQLASRGPARGAETQGYAVEDVLRAAF